MRSLAQLERDEKCRVERLLLAGGAVIALRNEDADKVPVSEIKN